MTQQEAWTLALITAGVFGVSYLYGNARFQKAKSRGTYYTSGSMAQAYAPTPQTATSYPPDDYS